MYLRGWTPVYGDTSDLHCTRFLSLRRIASAHLAQPSLEIMKTSTEDLTPEVFLEAKRI
jgi:hypothetical protein